MARQAAVGVLVPNLFVQVPVDAAIRAAGAVPVPLRSAEDEAVTDCALIVVDLGALGEDIGEAVRALRRSRAEVLAFAPHVGAELLRAARAAGAVAMPRGAFLARLPELLAAGLGVVEAH